MMGRIPKYHFNPSNVLILIILPVLVDLILLPNGSQAQYNDFRCKCICPSPNVVTNDTYLSGPLAAASESKPERSLYIANVPPQHCNCDWVVLPQLTAAIKAREFCPRCECKYESRNITTIKWVVTFIIAIIVCLTIYMGFLMLLDPLLHKGRRSQYEQQIDDDQTEMRAPGDEGVHHRHGSTSTDDSYTQFNSIIRSPSASFSGPSGVSVSGNVLNRAVQQQNKWKKQVQEQRKNIFDDHTMLN